MAWTKVQTLRNLIFLMIVWIGTFISYFGLDVLQTSINGDIGIYSITLANGCKLFSSFLGPVIMTKVTPKWTVCLSSICMMTFTLANFYPVWYTLLPAGALVGLTQGPMWISHGVYVTVMGVEYARLTGTSIDRVLSRISGFAASAIPVAIATGNFLSSVTLKNLQFGEDSLPGDMDNITASYYDLTTVVSKTDTYHHSPSDDPCYTSNPPEVNAVDTCGPHFCPEYAAVSNQTDVVEDVLPDKKAFYIFVGMLACFNILAILVAVFGLDNLHADQYRSKKAAKSTCCKTTTKYIKSFFDWRFLLLTPTICFMCLFMTFQVGLYPRAYVTCSVGVDMIGYVTMSRGIADFITCIMLGLIGQRLPRSAWLFLAWFVMMAITVVLLLWDLIEEGQPQLIMLFIVSSLAGCSNSINMSQFPAFLGGSFTDKKTEVFSFYQFSSSIIAALLYFSNIYICTATQLYMIVGFLPVGVAAYIVLSCYLHKTSQKHNHGKGAEYEKVSLKVVVQKSDGNSSS